MIVVVPITWDTLTTIVDVMMIRIPDEIVEDDPVM